MVTNSAGGGQWPDTGPKRCSAAGDAGWRLAGSVRRRGSAYHGAMRSAGPAHPDVPSWDIAVPSQPGRLAGVTMAGFSDGSNDVLDVQVIPHPAVMMIFDLGDTPIYLDNACGRQQWDRVVVGLAPSGARGLGGSRFELLQVRLSPLAARAILGASAELGGAVVSLDDLWGRDAARTQGQLRAARSWEDRFAIAEAAIARRLEARQVIDPEVGYSWRTMVASQGQVRIERLAAETGWSRKRLWSRFRSQIGLTPKRAAQLVRFDRAAHRLAAGYSPALVAADSGYADQSHLHRDVMAFAGATPAAVAASPFLAIDDVAWPTPHRRPRS
jgi:AraC-like DNA-binding protein